MLTEAIRRLAHRHLSLRESTPFRPAKGDTLTANEFSDTLLEVLETEPVCQQSHRRLVKALDAGGRTVRGGARRSRPMCGIRSP